MPQPGSRAAVRDAAFGERYRLTTVDRFCIWLSSRQIRRHASFAGKRVADVGCGFHASFVRSILQQAAHVTLVDVSLAPDLKGHSKITAIEPKNGSSPRALNREMVTIVQYECRRRSGSGSPGG